MNISRLHTTVFQNNPLSQVSRSTNTKVEFHSYDSPLINQWHHLISAIKKNGNAHQWVTLINPPFIPNHQYLKNIKLGDYSIRIVKLPTGADSSKQVIEQCLRNGKSSMVALWSDVSGELPSTLNDSAQNSCPTLVFSSQHRRDLSNQIELAF